MRTGRDQHYWLTRSGDSAAPQRSMNSPLKCTVALVLSWVLSLGGGAALAASPDESATTEPGTWQARELNFQFFGFTSTYSCDGLADTLKVMLKTLGVAKGLKVFPVCTRGYGRPDKLAAASLKFQTLQPQDAVRGDAGSAASPVPGSWRPVEFAWHKPYELGRGDCELVEQFANKILPLFATRNVQRNISCVPHQESGSVFDLTFEVFAPLPPSRENTPPRSSG